MNSSLRISRVLSCVRSVVLSPRLTKEARRNSHDVPTECSNYMTHGCAATSRLVLATPLPMDTASAICRMCSAAPLRLHRTHGAANPCPCHLASKLFATGKAEQCSANVHVKSGRVGSMARGLQSPLRFRETPFLWMVLVEWIRLGTCVTLNQLLAPFELHISERTVTCINVKHGRVQRRACSTPDENPQ